MSDLRTLLHEAAGPAPLTTAASVADADLARGHRALRRRRAGRVGAGSGLAVAAAFGAFAMVVPGVLSDPAATPPVSASGPGAIAPPASASSGKAIALVSYTGKQPTGYVLDKMPAGWVIRNDDVSGLTIAPEATTPAPTPEGAVSLEGTINVAQERAVPTGIPLHQVLVNGRPAVIAEMLGSGDVRTLFAEQPSGRFLTIQVWGGLGWSNDRIAEFASGVHITKAAQVTSG